MWRPKPLQRRQAAAYCGGKPRLRPSAADDDLERASELTRQMVTRFGMSERLGRLTYGRPLTARFLSSPFSAEERNYSERTA